MIPQLVELPALWYCEECLSRTHMVHGKAQCASRRQIIGIDNCSNFERSNGLVKQTSPLNCTAPRIQKPPHLPEYSPQMFANNSKRHYSMTGSSYKKKFGGQKTKFLSLEEVVSLASGLRSSARGRTGEPLRQVVGRKLLPCSNSGSTSTGRKSSKCITKRNGSYLMEHKMENRGIILVIYCLHFILSGYLLCPEGIFFLL